MRVAALYDIHGNLPALEAVLDDVRRKNVDLIIIGGDVLPGPMPREAIEHLVALAMPVRFISGNGDRMVREHMTDSKASLPEQARAWVEWTAQQLDPEHERVLAGWPTTQRMRIQGLGNVLFCHATRGTTRRFSQLTPAQQPATAFADKRGAGRVRHTHMQFDRMVGNTRVVNAGVWHAIR
jgi:predicted phosphodiesterase